MLLVGVVAFAPVAAVTWDVGWEAVPYAAVSAVLQLTYFVLLVFAYGRAELSLVYPIARGLAPVIVLVVTAAALAVRPSAQEAAGVVVVACGVLLVRGLARPADRRGVILGCAIAACIAGYTIVDKEGLRHAEPISYFELVISVSALAYPAFVVRRKGFGALRAELRPRAAFAGIAGFAAYALVLAALERAPAAAVSAVRETSVVIATALAAVVLRESVGPWRLVGAGAVAGGVALIALA